jgi:hypothetical protein
MKLSNVIDVVGAIGEDVSDGARRDRLTRTYTGKATTRATAIIADSRPNVRAV